MICENELYTWGHPIPIVGSRGLVGRLEGCESRQSTRTETSVFVSYSTIKRDVSN